MMLVIAERAAFPGEPPGTQLHDVEIYRSGVMTRTSIFLKHYKANDYSVAGGELVAIDLHSLGSLVRLSPIERSGYSHQFVAMTDPRARILARLC